MAPDQRASQQLAGPVADPVDGVDELVEDGDPYECEACLAGGEPCVFHRAWAAGWDACAAFMAAVVNGGAPDVA